MVITRHYRNSYRYSRIRFNQAGTATMNQMHISALTPDKGERVGTFGGSRSGKSSWMDWEMREVQRTRPKCAQLLLDTKPRFRGETIRHPWFTKQRRPARKLYQS